MSRPVRKAECPNCGGPIEMKLGSAHALVCPYCRFSVLRTGTELLALGKVADLVPTAADFAVGDVLAIGGHEALVGGRVQRDHGRGPWDEYFVEIDQQRWGWLAKAQGRWMLTYATEPTAALPPWNVMQPGQRGGLPGAEGSWVVQERGAARVVSAEGELPEPVASGDRGHYVDLAAEGGGIATIDYGDGSDAPQLFVGRELGPGDVRVVNAAMGERPQEKVEVSRLRCPTCGAPVPIRAPEITQRAACPSCDSLLDFGGGSLRMLKKLNQMKAQPAIPLGSEGTLFGEKLVVIGFMTRTTRVEGETFHWREYLLWCDEGERSRSRYRWLMEDNGHWIYLWPVSTADVRPGSMTCSFDGRSHKLFSAVTGQVSHVQGEFYWQVEAGESAELKDFIKPPRVISQERSYGPGGIGEEVWSAGEHVDRKELWKAFSLPGSPPPQHGVGVVQPNPVKLGFTAVVAALLLIGFCVVSAMFEIVPSGTVVMSSPLNVPVSPSSRGEPDTTAHHVTTSPPFALARATPLKIEVASRADNQYLGVVGALVNQETGEVADFYVDAGYYHGVSGGESWSEGSQNETAYLSSVPPGSYVLRLDPFWQSYPQPGAPSTLTPPSANVTVTAGKRSPYTMLIVLGLLLMPLILAVSRHNEVEKRRLQNSNILG